MYLIVGGSSDIGYELSKKLIKHDDVIITYNTKKNLKKIISKNKIITYLKLDLTKQKEIDLFIKKNQKLLKDIKFINLATAKADKLIINLNNKEIENVFKINVLSNIYFSKKILKLMIKQNYGRFIFFTSK